MHNLFEANCCQTAGRHHQYLTHFSMERLREWRKIVPIEILSDLNHDFFCI
jgi:hypothetical protein